MGIANYLGKSDRHSNDKANQKRYMLLNKNRYTLLSTRQGRNSSGLRSTGIPNYLDNSDHHSNQTMHCLHQKRCVDGMSHVLMYFVERTKQGRHSSGLRSTGIPNYLDKSGRHSNQMARAMHQKRCVDGMGHVLMYFLERTKQGRHSSGLCSMDSPNYLDKSDCHSNQTMYCLDQNGLKYSVTRCTHRTPAANTSTATA